MNTPTTTDSTTAATPAAEAEWWRHAVVYQIYVRSFADGNGDGTGDIAGMRARLPYLERLGIDAIWVNPWYHSPLHDGGYDVADYRKINEQFGTTAEAEEFIADARSHGIRVIVDLVPNHLSSDHRWFTAALASSPGSPERARFHFLPGRGDDGSEPPNDWRSVFGGPAWTRVTEVDGSPGEWYLHLFDTTQPDVNWENSEVAEELDAVMRFWLDRGASGFRVDVAHSLVKAPGYPDLGDRSHRDGAAWTEGHPHWDRDEIHAINRRWRATLDEYPDTMMVAEAWVRADRRPLYLRPDEYHQAFDFDFLGTAWDAEEFRRMIGSSFDAARAVGSHPTWVLSNHDVVRHATRYGLPKGVDSGGWLLDGPHDLLDAARGERRARAAALVTLGLPGSTYVYQGDELGLPEVWDLPTEVLDDPVWTDSLGTRKGRDGCRVPLPWTADGPSFGFGTAEPWMPQPDLFAGLAASEQDGSPSSTLELYRNAIRTRREVLAGGDHLEFGELGDDVLDIDRGGVRIVINMGDESIPMPPGEIIVSSDPDQHDSPSKLAPDCGVWLRG
ncbi:MAG: alpha-amylase family glycosyl hydrolase [Ilumatobacter sp.]